MPNLSGRSGQSQTDTAHNFAVLHTRFMPEYSYGKLWKGESCFDSRKHPWLL